MQEENEKNRKIFSLRTPSPYGILYIGVIAGPKGWGKTHKNAPPGRERGCNAMADNLAYQYEYEEGYRSEMLDGAIVLQTPRPAANHNFIAGNIYCSFANYLRGKQCVPVLDGMDVYLTKKDRVMPDVMIACDRNKIQQNGIHGAPDLVVEVLSPRTRKRDKGYKKDLYERCGVREYWIADPESKSVEVYLLKEGRFVLDEVYEIFPDYIVFEPGERETCKDSIPVSLYEDFSIPLEEIFYNVF